MSDKNKRRVEQAIKAEADRHSQSASKSIVGERDFDMEVGLGESQMPTYTDEVYFVPSLFFSFTRSPNHNTTHLIDTNKHYYQMREFSP
jgi:hypothetical protein